MLKSNEFFGDRFGLRAPVRHLAATFETIVSNGWTPCRDRRPGLLVKARFPSGADRHPATRLGTLRTRLPRVPGQPGGDRAAPRGGPSRDQGMGNYDYLVVNDDLETAVRKVEWIVRARRLRRERTIGTVGRILGKEGEERDGSSNG